MLTSALNRLENNGQALVSAPYPFTRMSIDPVALMDVATKAGCDAVLNGSISLAHSNNKEWYLIRKQKPAGIIAAVNF